MPAATTSKKTTAISAKPKAKKIAAKVTPPVAKNAKTAKSQKPPKAEVKSALKARPIAELKEKAKAGKLVRDSFTMPESEYAVLGDVKKACLKASLAVKKSELLRVGVALIQKMSVEQLKGALESLPSLKAGRPKKSK